MRYFVESYGCTMNFGEGKQLSGKLDSLGYERCDSAEDADLVVLNTCTVVETTEKKMVRRMVELKKQGKEIIVTGCLAKVQPKRVTIRLPDSLIIPPDSYHDFANAVKEKYGSFDYVPKKDADTCAILPIAQGCLGNCTYCITKFARGRLSSYREDELVSEFREMIGNGTKEILITAQDTACYGRDIGTTLPNLVKKMLETEGDYRIRIGMMNPNSLKPILDDLMDVMADERVYKFLHIPVQSGSDSILKVMKRHYVSEDFFGIVERIRERIPMMSIATDLICGFPGETDEDHRKSVELVEKLRADTINITRFSARPGTEAVTMSGQIQGNVSKERSTELTEMKMKVEADVNSNLVGKRFRVLVTEEGKPGTMIARTEYYRPVGIEGRYDIGTFLDVEVTDSSSLYVNGKVIN